MPYCQKCGAEIPALDQPCPQCAFRREDSPLAEGVQAADGPQPSPVSEKAPRGKRTRPLIISLAVVVALALVGVGISLAGGGLLPSTDGSSGSASSVAKFDESASSTGKSGGSASSAKANDPIVGRWSGTILEVDGDRAYLDPGDVDAVFKDDGTWLLTMNGKSNEGTWETYVDGKNDFDGYQFRVLGRTWLATITDEEGPTVLVAMSTDRSRTMCFTL